MLKTTTESVSQHPKKSETVFLDGAKVYYEVFGSGSPLFLLHGFTHSSRSWYPFIDEYKNDFEVYLIDLKGHGKSGMFTEKLSIRSAAKDLDDLIKYLRLDLINAIGYSYGGDVLFQLALLHPGLIKSMVVIGACGICNVKKFPEWIEFLSYKNILNLPWMHETQTSEEHIISILEQVPNYDVNVSAEEFKKIDARVLLVMGDGEDSILWEDILTAKRNLPNSFLWVLPDTPHGAHKEKNKEEFVMISREFFCQSWSGKQNS